MLREELRDSVAERLSPNALEVLKRRYLRRGPDGKPAETVEEMFRRVAHHIAKVETAWNGDVQATEEIFYDLLTSLRFVPNSPTFTGAGTPLGQLAACLTASMRVVTDQGLRPIADLRVGDLVLTHRGHYRPVIDLSQRPYEGTLLRIRVHRVDTPLEITPEHPVLTPKGWVPAGALQVGDRVAVHFPDHSHPELRDPDFLPIQSIEMEQFLGPVYNCEVAEDHTYVTEGVVVHNCFVLPISDDMGRRDDGIFQTLRNMALIHQTGGGTGFSFSRLRPKETVVISSGGKATGPIGFMRVYDLACEIVSQGGTRRGANMGVLRVDHPDIEEFITCKTDERAITNFNISVGVTDAFMRAVENDEEWELRFPDVLQPAYRTFHGTLEEAEQAGIPIKVYRKVRARDLFDKIVRQAHRNGEPGILFLDTMNRSNPCPHLGAYEATNPCGEQPLLPYENCCLGSINLARHVAGAEDSSRHIDWDLLRQTVEQAVRFLDNVVDANAYVPAIPQLKEAAQRTRRIGLGIMALGDVMYMVGVRYGSEEAQELASQIMEFIRYHAMRASIALARERGPFPAIRGSVYDPEDLRWIPPTPMVPYTRLEKWGRPPLDWGEILDGIRRYGIRNAAQLTIAPTGTIATIAGCEAYGCEPVYALAYTRKVHDEGREIELRYISPLFLQALERAGIGEPTREKILEQVLFTGSCQDVPEVPPEIRHVFVVAGDIPAEEHVRMQAALQAFVDAAISKTINFPADATPEDVARAYMLAWKLGCKGLTVYVTGSREKVVLETEAVRKARSGAGTGASAEVPSSTPVLVPVRPRPHILEGRTYRINTPLGTAYVTVNCNGEGEPFEVFLNVGKAGSDTAAVAEAIGRLISLILRVPSPLPARRRLQQVVRQLRGIGGGRPTGFGRDRVQSLPDGVAQVLAEFLGLEAPPEHPAVAQLPLFPLGDLCPECGHATLVNEEGCRRCYTCGYSEC